MSQDFKINIDADLNTAEAEQKLNALLKEKHKLTIDVDVSGQNTAKKLKQNIENGLKNVKLIRLLWENLWQTLLILRTNQQLASFRSSSIQ